MTVKIMSKRQTAIETIRIEFAEHGHATHLSTRALIENRISDDTYDKAARAGMKQFNEVNQR